MNFIQKTRDFCAKFFSKYFWRELWLDIRAFPRKRVSAEILETLCGYLNPSYSDLVDRFQTAVGHSHRLQSEEMVVSFHANREGFLTRLKSLLHTLGSVEWANSIYKELEAIYAPIPDKFKELAKQTGLGAHIIFSKNPVFGEVLSFINIQVEGEVNLTLGGRFHYWLFRDVKFCDAVTVSIYPSFFALPSKVDFHKNIFHDDFTCLFAFVKSIGLTNNKFYRSALIGADTVNLKNQDTVDQWKKDMIHYDITNFNVESTVLFSKNRCENLVALYNRNYVGGQILPGIKMVRFEGGNTIGGLSIPESKIADIGPDYYLHRTPRVRWVRWMHWVWFIPKRKKIKLYDSPISARGIPSVHFDINEHIKMPYKQEAPLYKEFFIDFKNKAIETHDREAEFNYGRKERYFDRAAATRWQDRFTLGWSQWVSDSGISWIRPIGWLIAVQAILAAAFIGWNVWVCASDWSVGGWAKTVIESFDPLSKVESKCADSLSAPFYNVARKIFLFLFLYETIKVFRRFSK